MFFEHVRYVLGSFMVLDHVVFLSFDAFYAPLTIVGIIEFQRLEFINSCQHGSEVKIAI